MGIFCTVILQEAEPVGKREFLLQFKDVPGNPPYQNDNACSNYKPAAVKEIVKSDVPSAGKTVICKHGEYGDGCNYHQIVSYSIRQPKVEKTVDGPLGTATGAFEACELKERAFGKPAAFSRIETHVNKK